jgi:hypothetical protein
MTDVFDVGTGVRLRGNFTVTGTFTDPDIIEMYLRKPDGTVETYTFVGGGLSQETTGKYFRDIFVDSSGQWWYEFFGSGTVNADRETSFEARRSVLP